MELVAVAAGQNGDDQRTAGEAELERRGHARELEGNGTEDDADEDAEEDGAHVGVVESLDGVAEQTLHAFHAVLRTYHHEAVADLDAQRAVGEEVHTRTRDTGHVHAVHGAEVHLAEGLAVHRALCHEDALRNDGRLLLLPVDFDLLADESHYGFGIVLGADGIHFVAHVEHGFLVRGEHFFAVAVVGADEGTAEELAQLKDGLALERLVLHAQRHVVGLGVGVVLLVAADFLLLLLELDAEDVADGDGGTDDAHYAQGIGAGVAVRDVLAAHVNAQGVDGFLGGTKTGGVGDGTVEHADGHRERRLVVRVEDEVVEGQHGEHVERHNADRDEVHLHTALLERLEEARTDLQTDAVHKQNQAEVLDKGQDLGGTGVAAVGVGNARGVVDVSDYNAREQHEGNAQGDAAELDLAEHNAHGNHQAVEHHDVRHRTGVREK